MDIPWGIVISFAVIGMAYVIKHLVCAVIEEDNAFFGIIIAFLFIYAAAAVAINYFNPPLPESETTVTSEVVSI